MSDSNRNINDIFHEFLATSNYSVSAAYSETKLALKKLVLERLPDIRKRMPTTSEIDRQINIHSGGFNEAIDQVKSIIEEIFQ